MVKLSDLLSNRLKSKEKPKTRELAKVATEGRLGSFAGIFGNINPSEKDREKVLELLKAYAPEETYDLHPDFDALIAITSEVKAISNQAAILHGERIKRAQEILKTYKEGAFTAWLKATYGNRQTPYNFLQYYEFYKQMPKQLHPKIEEMPRQAVYTLASRDGELEKKQELVQTYSGATKQELITMIRTLFPLDTKDKRRENIGDGLQSALRKVATTLETREVKLTTQQKKTLLHQLANLKMLINQTEEFSC